MPFVLLQDEVELQNYYQTIKNYRITDRFTYVTLWLNRRNVIFYQRCIICYSKYF